MTNPAHKICDHLSEAQAILHDHFECGKYTAEEALQKVNAALSAPRLMLAMQGVGYFENCMCESEAEDQPILPSGITITNSPV